MKKRWLSLFVENENGVLSKISGIFAGKLYNLDSLTVGTTEDPTMSRMTIGLLADDNTFEQIKKQLNRTIEVIKVLDFSDKQLHTLEVLFVRVNNCTDKDKEELFRIAQVFGVHVVDYAKSSAILQCVRPVEENDRIIRLMDRLFLNRIEVVRGGGVSIDALES
jgi:acetolactate synthase-1/3 small subunit